MTLEDKMRIKPVRRARKRPSLGLNRNANRFFLPMSQSNLIMSRCDASPAMHINMGTP